MSPTISVSRIVRGSIVCLAAIVVALAVLTTGTRAAGGGIITTVAGGGAGDGGPATSAGISPMGVAVDSSGNLYIAERTNCRVREVSGGTITTVAGTGACGFSGDGGPATSANLDFPVSVTLDSTGAIYIGDYGNCLVRKISGGIITTVAGNGTCGFSGDGGAATSAELNSGAGVAVDAAGDLYIADRNNCRVRKVSGGIITTVAGMAGCGFLGDGGPATSTRLFFPWGIALDSTGNLYIADTGNCRVRKVAGGMITTVVGDGVCAYGGDGGAATSAGVTPQTVALDSAGNIFIDDYNPAGCRVREVSGGVITTIAGGATCGNSGDGGPATSATVQYPGEVAVDSSGNVYVGGYDGAGCRVREVSAGIISTVAGNGACSYGGDGGTAANASLDQPNGVAVVGRGNIFIADTENCRVREVLDGTITTIAGNGTCMSSGDGGPATSASLWPYWVAVDAQGSVYISDKFGCEVRKVMAGTISDFAGGGGCSYSGDGGAATAAGLSAGELAFDGDDALYIADGTNCRVRKVAAGIITTVAGSGNCTSSGDGGPATSAGMRPAGIAVDHAGDLYISDHCLVRKVSAGTITTVAGNATCGDSGDGGPASASTLAWPAGLTVDGANNLYIAEEFGCRVREIAAGVITTVAGGACGFSGDGGAATAAGLADPMSVSVDGAGNLYIADPGSNRIREVTTTAAPPSVGGIAQAPDVTAPAAGAAPAPDGGRGWLELALLAMLTGVVAAGVLAKRRRRSRPE